MRSTYQIFQGVVGSQAYGTATEKSDRDVKGIYVQDHLDLLSFEYKPQIDFSKDHTEYEIQRFLQLLSSGNPTMLELLFLPADCVVKYSPEMALLHEHRSEFVTKQCANAFSGYAYQQISKAKGLDKKMNYEKDKITRKTPMDFCYAAEDGQTKQLADFLFENKMKQEYCGLVALDHFRDCYALYYDFSSRNGLAGKGYHGISLDDSNSIRLSSVPVDQVAITIVFYNKDAYSQHCRSYREYQDWLKNRNESRYVDTQTHGQKIDGKNLMHCRRLLDMALEICTTGQVNVRRPNAQELLKIRRGEVSLENILAKAEEDVEKLGELFKKSDLPDSVDPEKVNNILLAIRESVLKHHKI